MDVDLVYTWVDGTDRAWLEKRKTYEKNRKTVRFEQSGAAIAASSEIELFYSICSVKKFMPWIRNIYIVTDQHIPVKTIQAFPDLKVIDHKAIFPKNALLPTFNSRAIELALLHIEGLAEHFIYMNDDMFVNRAIRIEDFYFENKIAIFIEKIMGISITPELAIKTGLYTGSAIPTRHENHKILNSQYGYKKRFLLQHSPVFVTKKSYSDFQQKFSKEINATYNQRFRCINDVVPLQFMYHYFMLQRNAAYINKKIIGYRFDIYNYTFLNMLRCFFIRDNIHFFCLNDGRTKSTHKNKKQMLSFLEKKYGDIIKILPQFF